MYIVDIVKGVEFVECCLCLRLDLNNNGLTSAKSCMNLNGSDSSSNSIKERSIDCMSIHFMSS